MKNCFLIAALLISFVSFGQSTIASVSYDKTNQKGLMLIVPFDEEVAEGAIVKNLRKTGYDPETKGKLFWKQDKLNGFYVFRDVNLNGNLVDLYMKVDGRKRRTESAIYLLMGKEDAFFDEKNEAVFQSAKVFLDGFTDETAAYQHELDVKEQEETIKDAEKKLSKMQSEEKDIERRIEKMQSELEKNRKDQKDQEKTIEEEKKKLEDLKKKNKA